MSLLQINSSRLYNRLLTTASSSCISSSSINGNIISNSCCTYIKSLYHQYSTTNTTNTSTTESSNNNTFRTPFSKKPPQSFASFKDTVSSIFKDQKEYNNRVNSNYKNNDTTNNYNNKTKRRYEGGGEGGEEEMKMKYGYGYNRQDELFKELQNNDAKVLNEYIKRKSSLSDSKITTDIVVKAFIQFKRLNNINLFEGDDKSKEAPPSSNNASPISLTEIFGFLMYRLIHTRYPVDEVATFLKEIGAKKDINIFKSIFATEKPTYIIHLKKIMDKFGIEFTIPSREHALYVRALYHTGSVDQALEEFEKIEPDRVNWFYLETMVSLFINTNRIPEAKKLMIQLRRHNFTDSYVNAAIDLTLALGHPKLAADYLAFACQQGFALKNKKVQSVLYSLSRYGEFELADKLFATLERCATDESTLSGTGFGRSDQLSGKKEDYIFTKESLTVMMLNVYSNHPNRNDNPFFKKYYNDLVNIRNNYFHQHSGLNSYETASHIPNLHTSTDPQILFKESSKHGIIKVIVKDDKLPTTFKDVQNPLAIVTTDNTTHSTENVINQ